MLYKILFEIRVKTAILKIQYIHDHGTSGFASDSFAFYCMNAEFHFYRTLFCLFASWNEESSAIAGVISAVLSTSV